MKGNSQLSYSFTT